MKTAKKRPNLQFWNFFLLFFTAKTSSDFSAIISPVGSASDYLLYN